MAEDPYRVLGVDRSADDAAIKAAYRKLAKQYHPDLNRSEEAEKRFKAVNAAFGLLGDPDKKRRFDAGLIDADGQERAGGFGGAGFGGWGNASGFRARGQGPGASGHTTFDEEFVRGFRSRGTSRPRPGEDPLSDLFSEFFGDQPGSAAPGVGADRRYRLNVDFIEAATGTTKRLELPGLGQVDLTIPAGLRDGQTLRLKGRGEPGPGGAPPGDALVTVHIRRHPHFQREDPHIRLSVPVTLDEAVLGAAIRVPTIHGAVEVNVPPGTATGRTLRLKGKGLQVKGQPPGDQLITLNVLMPERIDGELRQFFKRWREQHPQPDPRRKLFD